MKVPVFLAAIGAGVAVVLGMACSEGQEPDVESAQPVAVDTIEDAQRLVHFPLAVPAELPPELEFARAFVSDLGENASVVLEYRATEAARMGAAETSRFEDVGVWINQSAADVGMGRDPSNPVQIQGTTGYLIRGEDVGNPGLVVVQWRKGDISYYAYTFPDDSFTEDEFLEFLNSLEWVIRQG